MKKVRVEDAVGMTLCHDLTEMRDGFKGPAFRRGHVIAAEDIPHMLDIGKRTVFVWEENAGEIHEEDAARRMAAMAPVSGAHYTEPSEGKVELFAETDGLFQVDEERLIQVNTQIRSHPLLCGEPRQFTQGNDRIPVILLGRRVIIRGSVSRKKD